MNAFRHQLPLRFAGHSVYLCLFLSQAGGCCRLADVPDQDEFEVLGALAATDEAVVRVYGSTIPFLQQIAIHTWVVTKRAGEHTFHRWEIWLCPEGDYGVVCLDRAHPAQSIAWAPPFVLGQKIGEAAESIVAFVEQASPQYPFQNTYFAVPGPNSNTYVQWVLNNTGWSLKLQPCAVGADWEPATGWPTVVIDDAD